jgi:hypothetical protein
VLSCLCMYVCTYVVYAAGAPAELSKARDGPADPSIGQREQVDGLLGTLCVRTTALRLPPQRYATQAVVGLVGHLLVQSRPH